MINKRILRAELRRTRTTMPRIPVPVYPAFLDRLIPGLVVATYIAVGGEADPKLFDEVARSTGCRLALPHVTSRAEPIRFLEWCPDARLIAGPFGLSQPHGEARVMVPDIVLTPLVGFDRQGNRVGQGAGHYDRAFATYPDAWRIGIAWSSQEVPTLAPDPWDVPLHALATEKEWIMPVDAR